MSAVDEAIVREYFEHHGFLVSQRRKYVVSAREKTPAEEVDLIVFNPHTVTGAVPGEFEITTELLGKVARALVSVKGWHTELFSPSVLKHQPKIFKFVEKETIAAAQKLVGGEGLLKLLVIPGLPRGSKARQASIDLLKQKGVDGVICFPAILQELISNVATNRNYRKSDLLQTLRLLKNYGLLQDPQMEFRWKGRKKQQ